jgi:tRNA threonylcarbamoyladenosine biosynthesis protein TsaB
MRVLAIDTSTRQVTAAVGNEDGLLGSITIGGPAASGPPRHTETLVPALDQLLRSSGTDPALLTTIGVGVGPGMFTGLRAGVVTATVLARALDVPVAAVSSLDAVAQPVLGITSGLVAAIVDARRAEVFHALYRARDGGWERVSDDAVGRPADVAAALAAHGEPVLLCGDAAGRVLEHAPSPTTFASAGAAFDAPSPHALVALTRTAVARGDLHAPSAVLPRYLRKSDAEINVDIRSERNPVPQP